MYVCACVCTQPGQIKRERVEEANASVLDTAAKISHYKESADACGDELNSWMVSSASAALFWPVLLRLRAHVHVRGCTCRRVWSVASASSRTPDMS